MYERGDGAGGVCEMTVKDRIRMGQREGDIVKERESNIERESVRERE